MRHTYLGVSTGHADGEAFVEGFEASEDEWTWQHLEEKGQQVQCHADIGGVGHHVPSAGVSLGPGRGTFGYQQPIHVHHCILGTNKPYMYMYTFAYWANN